MLRQDTIVYRPGKLHISVSGTRLPVRIAGFDLDGTIITTDSKRHKAAASTASWAWWHSTVPDRLRKLHADGYVVALFSNQSSLSGGKKDEVADKEKTLSTKLDAVIESLGFEPFILAATTHDKNFKPATGMWKTLESLLGRRVDMGESWFVGDAAGREGDFATSDRHFALNVGVRFFQPEEFFLHTTAITPLPDIYDKGLIDSVIGTGTDDRGAAVAKYIQTELVAKHRTNVAILMIGPPGSGKSTLCGQEGFKTGVPVSNIICQDVLGTKAKTLTAVKAAVKAGANFVIDKNFEDKETRAEYLSHIPVTWLRVAINMKVSREYAEHMNWVRAESSGVPCVGRIRYAIFYKDWVEPVTAEGFDIIINVEPFISTTHRLMPFIKRRYIS